MTARFNILAMLVGLVIVSVTLIPDASRAGLQGLFQHVTNHDHKAHDHGADVEDRSAQSLNHMTAHKHGDRGDPRGCWEHCADMLASSLFVGTQRQNGAVLSPNAHIAPPHILSSKHHDRVSPPSLRRSPLDAFEDHRTGVSRILRTSMRLRN